MHIGNHYLLGKIVQLKNPLILCKKVRVKKDVDIVEIKNDNNHNNNNENDTIVTEINIEKTYKTKIVFNTRPTPKLI